MVALLVAVLALGLSERTLGPVRTAVGTIIYPISRPIMEATQSVRSIAATIHAIKTLRADTQSLLSQNQALTAKVAELEAVRHENDSLRIALSFAEANQDEHLIVSQIVGRSPTTFLQSVEVDKGDVDGVKIDAPVIADGYFVGIVIRTSAHRSTIRFITSNDSLVAVLFTTTRAQGLLRGGLAGLVVNQVPLDAYVEPDEPVVTSALGGVVPANIPVGLAQKVQSTSSSIYQEIPITSPVNFSKLELVFIGEPVVAQ